MAPSTRKVLLIQQDLGRRGVEYPLFPLGLAYIAAALRDHKVKIFDPNLYPLDESGNRLQYELEALQPDIVGISLRNIDTTMRRDPFVHYKTIAPMVGVIKQMNALGKIVIGGPAFSLHAGEIMERIPGIDFGVYLEGDETVVELLDHLEEPELVKGIFFRKGGVVHFTGERPQPDFAVLSRPKRDGDVIDISRYVNDRQTVIGVQSKRGCALDCSYCTYVFLNKDTMRLRTPAHVADEIEEMVDRLGVKGFIFVDNVFNIPEEHSRGICEEMIRRKISVEWAAWLTPRGLTKDFLLLMKQAGCRRVRFSPDAGTDHGLRVLSKGCTAQDIEESIRLLSKIEGMFVGYNFFCGYPGMTWSDAAQTLRLLLKISALLPDRYNVSFNWIRVEPHTGICSQAIKERFISEETNMLPEDEKGLLPLFYAPQRLRRITNLFDFVISSMGKEGITWRVLSNIAKGFWSSP
jgi:radical SAM superfamily enzyme YgiQ (UPF0313 family)